MNWLGYAKSGREVEVQEELRGLGIEAWVPIAIEAKRVGKNRYPEVIERPFLPNTIFIRGDEHDFHRMLNVRSLARVKHGFPDKAWSSDVAPFIDKIAAEYRATKARIDSGERLSMFRKGQQLVVEGGAFMDRIAKFNAIVELDNSPFPKISAEIEMMGRSVNILLDPLDVKAG